MQRTIHLLIILSVILLFIALTFLPIVGWSTDVVYAVNDDIPILRIEMFTFISTFGIRVYIFFLVTAGLALLSGKVKFLSIVAFISSLISTFAFTFTIDYFRLFERMFSSARRTIYSAYTYIAIIISVLICVLCFISIFTSYMKQKEPTSAEKNEIDFNIPPAFTNYNIGQTEVLCSKETEKLN